MVGGHTHTHHINLDGESHNIDTGFIVFNKKTYPQFLKLLQELKVDYQPSHMGFSARCESTGLEYSGTNINTLFAQRRNLFKPSFYRMIKDILRFNKECVEVLYGHQDHNSMFDFSAKFFIRFFNNHGLLNINDRPQWYVIKNGSKQYVKPLISDHKENIHLSTPVKNIIRQNNQVIIRTLNQPDKTFDYVFIATHSDQALTMLDKPTSLEQQTLSALKYTPNTALLHTDITRMPKRKLAWAAWNYHLNNKNIGRASLSYNMNILQSLKSKNNFIVTLNNSSIINQNKIIKSMSYSHPLFTLKGIAAQKNHSKINGTKRTFYSGAYWRHGFHEDGVVSAMQALKDFDTQHMENTNEC